jgi:hypothetical protein
MPVRQSHTVPGAAVGAGGVCEMILDEIIDKPVPPRTKPGDEARPRVSVIPGSPFHVIDPLAIENVMRPLIDPLLMEVKSTVAAFSVVKRLVEARKFGAYVFEWVPSSVVPLNNEAPFGTTKNAPSAVGNAVRTSHGPKGHVGLETEKSTSNVWPGRRVADALAV